MSLSSFFAFLHSFLEILPISSSWHMQHFFGLSSWDTHILHRAIMTVLLGHLALFSEKRALFKQPLLCLIGLLPGLIIYLCIKNHLLPKFTVPMYIVHIIMGLLLSQIGRVQRLSPPYLRSIKTPMIWILCGWAQTLCFFVSGSSRFGVSLLGGLFYRLDFQTTFLISFWLDLSILTASFILDVLKNQVGSGPDFLEVLLSFLGISLGWNLLWRYQWFMIEFSGYYRLILGLLLWGGLL